LRPTMIPIAVTSTDPNTEKAPLVTQILGMLIVFLLEEARLMPVGKGIPIKKPNGIIIRKVVVIRTILG